MTNFANNERFSSPLYHAKGTSLAEQYEDTGRLFGEYIRAAVARVRRRRKGAALRRAVAERALACLVATPVASEFLRCLRAWARGAAISELEAMWLMADNFGGCQTVAVRYGSGVALLHTEEDAENVQARMRPVHTIVFSEPSGTSNSLVYNDMLPGAALYGWKKDMLTAVDTLYLSEHGVDEIERPALANVISWLVWRMQPEDASAEAVQAHIAELGEVADGYTIQVVRRTGATIDAYKITFARGDTAVEHLGDGVGAYLRQVNIIDPDYIATGEPVAAWRLPPRNMYRGYWRHFLDRLATIDRTMARYAPYTATVLSKETLERSHRNVQATLFGDLRSEFINSDVGAVCVGFLDQRCGTSVSCKVPDHRPLESLEYIDILE